MALKHFIKAVVILCSMLVSTSLFAQDTEKRTPKETAVFQTNWLKGNLDLTADQCDRVYLILLDHAQAEEQANKDPKKAELVKTADSKRDADLKAVLNEAQFKKFMRGMYQK